MEQVINLYRSGIPTINDAYDRAVFNICLQKEKFNHKSFLLCGCEPKVGTTSIVLELSISLSVAGWKVLLLDGDLRKGNNYKRLNDGIRSGLADYICGKAKKEEILGKTNWENLTYVSCGNINDNNPLQLLYSPKLIELLDSFYQEYDFILIDVPAASASVDAEIFSVKADAIILVCSLDGRKKKVLEKAYKDMNKNNVNVIGVIENRVSMSEYKGYAKDYNYFTQKRFIPKEVKGGKRN